MRLLQINQKYSGILWSHTNKKSW